MDDKPVPAVEVAASPTSGPSSSSTPTQPPLINETPVQELAIDKADEKNAAKKNKFELTDQTNYLPSRMLITVFMGLNAAVLVSVWDQSIVSTAIPTISAHFNAGE